jgi:hypothetical protein
MKRRIDTVQFIEDQRKEWVRAGERKLKFGNREQGGAGEVKEASLDISKK